MPSETEYRWTAYVWAMLPFDAPREYSDIGVSPTQIEAEKYVDDWCNKNAGMTGAAFPEGQTPVWTPRRKRKRGR